MEIELRFNKRLLNRLLGPYIDGEKTRRTPVSRGDVGGSDIEEVWTTRRFNKRLLKRLLGPYMWEGYVDERSASYSYVIHNFMRKKKQHSP